MRLTRATFQVVKDPFSFDVGKENDNNLANLKCVVTVFLAYQAF
jgi:hypothetical protein